MATKKRQMTEHYSDPPSTLTDHTFYGMQLDTEQMEFANAIWNPDVDIVFCNAKAGTGKTTVAVGVANLLVKYGLFDEIIYIMSPYGERKQGWLPGTITEKSAVYFEALYQALANCDVNPYTSVSTENLTAQKNGTGYITCITDTFLRGTNLENAVIILDEAQNYTVSQLKKTLTRVGKKVKVVVIGHELQCDLDNPSQSGFIKYIEHFHNKERTAVCTLTANHRSWISMCADEVQE